MRFAFTKLLAPFLLQKINRKTKNCHDSTSNQNRNSGFSYRKFETLGSNFSHEIHFCEAAGVRCHSKQIFGFFYSTTQIRNVRFLIDRQKIRLSTSKSSPHVNKLQPSKYLQTIEPHLPSKKSKYKSTLSKILNLIGAS